MNAVLRQRLQDLKTVAGVNRVKLYGLYLLFFGL